MTTPFAIYEDQEDQELVSSDMLEGDTPCQSEQSPPDVDDVMASVELDHDHNEKPEPYKSSYTSRKSSLRTRRSSGVTQYGLISGIPSESSVSSTPIAQTDEAESRYSPRKDRSRFRNPESVRAMQMSSPPPLPAYEASRERLKGSYKLMTPSKSGISETPISRKSGSRRGSIKEAHSPRPTPTPQQAPLVLLHVTILPPQLPYSHDVMVRVMPEWLVENYKVLEEKLQDIILMRRGLLIPHPRDEYDLLEERILESLELKTPRLLKCGHFVPPDTDTDNESEDDLASVIDDCTGRGSRMSGGTLTLDHENHMDACTDCHRELKRPGRGVGAGKRRWDLKIYAANGLMREAAWTACWNDMERCDVEISPWIPDDIRKTMERRVLEEQEADKRKQLYAIELQLQIQQAASKQKILEEEAAERKRREEAELQKSFESAAAALERSKEEKAAEKKKFEEILETKIEEAKESMSLKLEAQALLEAKAVAERIRALEVALQKQKPTNDTTSDPVPIIVQKRRVSRAMSGQHRSADIPLGVLLKNYILVLIRDQRNFIIVLLSVVVIYMSVNMDPPSQTQLSPPPMIGLPDVISQVDPVSTIAVTTTATTTATSFSTFTITEVVTATSMAETLRPILQDAEPIAVEMSLPLNVAADQSTEPLSMGLEPIVENVALPSPATVVEPSASIMVNIETEPSTPSAQELPSPPTIKDIPSLAEEDQDTTTPTSPVTFFSPLVFQTPLLPICAKDEK